MLQAAVHYPNWPTSAVHDCPLISVLQFKLVHCSNESYASDLVRFLLQNLSPEYSFKHEKSIFRRCQITECVLLVLSTDTNCTRIKIVFQRYKKIIDFIAVYETLNSFNNHIFKGHWNNDFVKKKKFCALWMKECCCTFSNLQAKQIQMFGQSLFHIFTKFQMSKQ